MTINYNCKTFKVQATACTMPSSNDYTQTFLVS